MDRTLPRASPRQPWFLSSRVIPVHTSFRLHGLLNGRLCWACYSLSYKHGTSKHGQGQVLFRNRDSERQALARVHVF